MISERMASQGVKDNVENPPSKFHDAERVLEAAMRCAGIHQIRHGQLVDVTKPLEWPAVQYFPFARLNSNEIVNRIADLMEIFGH